MKLARNYVQDLVQMWHKRWYGRPTALPQVWLYLTRIHP